MLILARLVFPQVLVSDDTFHELRFERLACRYGLTIDGRRELSSVSPTCIAGTEGNTGRIFLGGSRTGSANGFIGCMHNTLIDGEDVGLDILVDDTTAGVKQGCGNAETCAACKNSAICQTKTIGVSCDCSKTDGFAGETCSERKRGRRVSVFVSLRLVYLETGLATKHSISDICLCIVLACCHDYSCRRNTGIAMLQYVAYSQQTGL